MNKHEQDLNFGLSQEDHLLHTIQQKYPNVIKTNLHSPIDYECKDYVIELKSRRCKHTTYPSTMISKSKIDFMLTSSKKGVCLFNFVDGLYEIEITPQVIDKFECGYTGRTDRGRKEYNLYYFIPRELLNIFGIQI